MVLDYSKIELLCAEHRINMSELAKKAKLAPLTLVSVKKGKNVTLNTVNKITEALSCRPIDII